MFHKLFSVNVGTASDDARVEKTDTYAISFPESLFPLTSGRKTRGTKTQGTRLTAKGRILIGSLNAVRTQIVKMDCSGKAMVLLTMKPWVPNT